MEQIHNEYIYLLLLNQSGGSEAIEPWKTIHPNLKFLPMEWEYKIPYGLVSAHNLTSRVQKFIQNTLALNITKKID